MTEMDHYKHEDKLQVVASIVALCTVFIFALLCPIVWAQDLQLFNPDFLGQPTTNAIKLLLDKKADEIEPYMVTTDIKCGKYIAASAFYPKKVTFAQARASLDKIYASYENLSLYKESMQALWRVEDK